MCGHSDVHRFEFPGYVPPSELKFETLEAVDRKTLHHPSRGTLNEIYATAICGNDLTSSVLYVIGVTTTLSGQLAPLCLITVGLVLYLFKSVYGEVGPLPPPPSHTQKPPLLCSLRLCLLPSWILVCQAGACVRAWQSFADRLSFCRRARQFP